MRSSAFVLLLAATAFPGVALAKDTDPCSRPPEQLEAVDNELLAAWKADKEDRERQSPDTLKNDAKRVKAVAKLDAKGYVCSPLNAFHAAWVLQRSNDPAHVQKAYDYAKKAMDARIQNGEWLSAVTFDLLQIRYGRPQRFGTQMISLADKVCLYPVAADATDEERKQYAIRPIGETYRQVLDLNGLTNAPASAETIELEELWCPAQKAPGQ